MEHTLFLHYVLLSFLVGIQCAFLVFSVDDMGNNLILNSHSSDPTSPSSWSFHLEAANKHGDIDLSNARELNNSRLAYQEIRTAASVARIKWVTRQIKIESEIRYDISHLSSRRVSEWKVIGSMSVWMKKRVNFAGYF